MTGCYGPDFSQYIAPQLVMASHEILIRANISNCDYSQGQSYSETHYPFGLCALAMIC